MLESSSKSKKKQNRSKKKKKSIQPLACVDPENEEIDLHEMAISKKQRKKLEREKILTNNTEKKLSPRTLRRLKLLMEEAKPAPPEPKYMNDLIDFTGLEHRCAYCNQSFISKNKLFKHLNSTGHDTPLPNETNSNSSKNVRNRK